MPQTKIEEPQWRRKYWCPWGRAIGFHDEGFVHIGGRTYCIHRHHDQHTEAVLFYVPHGFTNGKGDCLRFKRFAACCRFLQAQSPLPLGHGNAMKATKQPKIVVRQCSMTEELYLGRDGQWGEYRQAKRFRHQDQAVKFAEAHGIPETAIGLFPCS
jgi:hypothetical protein